MTVVFNVCQIRQALTNTHNNFFLTICHNRLTIIEQSIWNGKSYETKAIVGNESSTLLQKRLLGLRKNDIIPIKTLSELFIASSSYLPLTQLGLEEK